MTEHRPIQPHRGWTAPLASGIPPDFVPLADSLPAAVEQKLGYFGEARFVAFSYEPRMDTVIWEDGRSSGLAYGAWFTSIEEIAPLPYMRQATLFHPLSEPHVLVIDRAQRQSFCAERTSAERFLGRQQGPSSGT